MESEQRCQKPDALKYRGVGIVVKVRSPPRLKQHMVAVKELNLSYYIGETILFTIPPQYVNSI